LKLTQGKREAVIYITILLWIIFGILGVMLAVSFTGLAAYFVSLTGFVGAYIWGESKRPSSSTPIHKKGPSSRREIMIYLTLALWTGLGIYGMMGGIALSGLAAYFGSLSPFIGAYILGETVKPQGNKPNTTVNNKPNYTEKIDLSKEP
jgi:hypothetical protein